MPIKKHDDELLVVMLARTVALDLLLRDLYATIAAAQTDPRVSLFARLEMLVGSLDAQPRASGTERHILSLAEEDLRHFFANVERRLEDRGIIAAAAEFDHPGDAGKGVGLRDDD